MTLTLSISNFRCWESKIITIPQQGICLLSGKSGKGKSSILNSIVYCITGKGKNISTFQKKSTSVKLAIDNLVITRTRGPSRLIVEKDSKKYENDEAQSIINSVFGSEFCNTSYIDQDNINSFVFLSPSAKIEFLENLLLSQYEIEHTKNKIKDAISKTKLAHAAEESKINTLKNVLSTYKAPEQSTVVVDINDKKITITHSNYQKIMEKMSGNLEVVEKNLKTSQLKLKKNEQEYDSFLKTNEKRSNLTYSLEELQRQLNEIVVLSDIDNMERQKEEYVKQKEERLRLEKYDECKTKYETIFEKNKKELTEYHKKIENIPKPDKKVIQNLEKAKELLESLILLEDQLNDKPEYEALIKEKTDELSITREKTEELQKILTDFEKCYECPSCHKILKFNQQRLIQASIDKPIDVATITQEISEFKKVIDRLEKEIKQLNKDYIIYQKNDKEYNETFDRFEKMLILADGVVIEQEKIDDELEKRKKDDKEYEKIKKMIQQLEEDRLLIDTKGQLDRLTVQVSGISLKEIEIKNEEEYIIVVEGIAKHKEKTRQQQQLTKKINDVTNELSLLSSVKEDKNYGEQIEIEREKIDQYMKKSEFYKEYLQKVEKWEIEYQTIIKHKEMEKTVLESEKKKEDLLERLRCLVKLRDHVKNSERKAISDFVESLNDHASLYIEQFFPDEDINVKLQTVQENKTGKESISLHFEVVYREMTGDLSFLSGGEKDRVNLAFTLAFSELVDNRMLLLDECISSLDAETTSVVLENLKEKYRGKLILLVSHQATTGFFDHVLEV